MPAITNQRARKLSFALGVVISVLLLIYLLRGMNWISFAGELSRINLWYAPALLLILLLMVWLRALRWKLFLPNGGQLPTLSLFKALLVGFLANFILPLRAGELARPWILSKWQPVSFATGLASIVIERIFDGATLFALFGICLLRTSNVPEYLVIAAALMGGISLGVLVMVIASYFFKDQINGWIHARLAVSLGVKKPELTSRILKATDDFFNGLSAIRSPGALLGAFAWSLAVWTAMALWYQVALWACGQYPNFWVGMMINIMVALAVAAPSAPGFIGTFQAGCIVALVVLGPYTREFAMAYSILAHGFQMLVIISAGLITLQREGLRLRQVAATSRQY